MCSYCASTISILFTQLFELFQPYMCTDPAQTWISEGFSRPLHTTFSRVCLYKFLNWQLLTLFTHRSPPFIQHNLNIFPYQKNTQNYNLQSNYLITSLFYSDALHINVIILPGDIVFPQRPDVSFSRKMLYFSYSPDWNEGNDSLNFLHL